jgi:hypothetical protein
MKVLPQLVAQVRKAQVNHRLKHAAVRLPQSLVHQLGLENSGPPFVQITARIGIAQRSQKGKLGEWPVERIQGAAYVTI